MRFWTKVLSGVIAVFLALSATLLAQQPPAMIFSSEKLGQVTAPVARSPDPLLA